MPSINGTGKTPAVAAAILSARRRYYTTPALFRPANFGDILTAGEAHVLARSGYYPLFRDHLPTFAEALAARPAGRRRARALVRREIESAIPIIVAAVVEAIAHGR
jgi:hypothetical protein